MVPNFIAILAVSQCLILGSLITLVTIMEEEFQESEHFWKESAIMGLLVFLIWQAASIVYFKQIF